MKLRNAFLPILASMAIAMGLSPKGATGVSAASVYDTPAEQGVVTPDSYFGSVWNMDVGAVRISERSVLVNDLSDWGRRGGFLNRTYDATSLEITVELSQILGNTGFQLIFGSAPGSYDGEASKQLVMDIIVGNNPTSNYIVTASTFGAHNNSIPGFTDGNTWADDANFVGVQASTMDYRVTIKINKVNDVTTNVSVNDYVCAVATSDLFARFEDPTKSYLALGMFNNAGTRQNYVIESIGDASDKIYFGAEGDFTYVKNALTTLKTADVSSLEATKTAKEAYDAMNARYAKLYTHDRAYFAAAYNEVTTRINEAVAAAGNELAVILYGENVAGLTTACETLTTVAEVDAALAKKAEADAVFSTIDAGSLTGEALANYNAYQSAYETAIGKLLQAIETVYDGAIAAYEAKVSALATAIDIRDAYTLRSGIPTRYAEYLVEEKALAFATRVDNANNLLAEKTTLTHDNWEQGAGARVITNQDGSLDILMAGHSNSTPNAESAGIYCKEATSAIGFQTVINVSNFGRGSGAWITMGLMEKPEMWVYAETDAVQDNKGIFFLITYVNSTTLSVQAFLCSLTSNRFYDSNLIQTIQIPMATDVEVKFYETTETIAGVTETYFNMSFNGVTFDRETVTSRKIKTVLGSSKEGYFILAGDGFSSNDPTTLTLKEINGKAPTAASINSDEVPVPASTDTEKTINQGSSTDLAFHLDTYGQDITSVKVDGADLDAANYSFLGTTFTLKGSFLSGLEARDHEVTVATAGGTVTWLLHVKAAETSSEPDPIVSSGEPVDSTEGESKGGCGGSIIAASSLLGVITCLGAAILIKKKSEK